MMNGITVCDLLTVTVVFCLGTCRFKYLNMKEDHQMFRLEVLLFFTDYTFSICNMGTSGLPDMYTPRAKGRRATSDM